MVTVGTRNRGPFGGMVFSMATTKITITLPDEQIHSIRELVAAGKAGSVSAFVKHAVAIGLFDAAGWRTMLNDALSQTGGSLTKEERKWADALLHPPEGKMGAANRSRRKNRAA
jgi:Arc/MetJ-type ribon-helix-helix transcriptional regulator